MTNTAVDILSQHTLSTKNKASINKYFINSVTNLTDIDSDERVMLIVAYQEFIKFSIPYFQQTFFHSASQWAKRLNIGEKTAKRKIKSLGQKGYWKIISGAATRETNIFQLSEKITSNIGQNGPIPINTRAKMTQDMGQNDPSHMGQNDPDNHIKEKSYYNHVCEGPPSKQVTHTKTEIIKSKNKNRNMRDKLAGVIADFVKMHTKQNYVSFAITGKIVDRLLDTYTQASQDSLFDHFCDFQSHPYLREHIDLNQVSLTSVERAFVRYLENNKTVEKIKTKDRDCLKEGKTEIHSEAEPHLMHISLPEPVSIITSKFVDNHIPVRRFPNSEERRKMMEACGIKWPKL